MRTAQTRTSKRPRKPLSVADESSLAKKRRARKINRTLAEAYPQAHCELDFQSPFQLIVATVLSAQCTDAQVNKVTPALFRAYPDAEDLATARQADVEQLIHSTGFYRNKAKNIIGLGQALEENFGGEVPDTLDQLVTLPGVGRKTANVVLGNAFDTPGLTVDTHFGRLSRRLGLTTQEDPVKVESDIAQLIEPSEWTDFSHRLIFHGRRVCHARTAACGACFLAGLCPSFGQYGPADPESAEKLIKSPDKEHLLAMAGLIPDDAGDSQDTEVDAGASHG